MKKNVVFIYSIDWDGDLYGGFAYKISSSVDLKEAHNEKRNAPTLLFFNKI